LLDLLRDTKVLVCGRSLAWVLKRPSSPYRERSADAGSTLPARQSAHEPTVITNTVTTAEANASDTASAPRTPNKSADLCENQKRQIATACSNGDAEGDISPVSFNELPKGTAETEWGQEYDHRRGAADER
jgi:hypothetical protein